MRYQSPRLIKRGEIVSLLGTLILLTCDLVKIRTPVDVALYFHRKHQLTMPKELIARIYFSLYYSIEQIEGKQLIWTKRKGLLRCGRNGDKNFGEHKNDKILEKFNCTTHFIPLFIRKDSQANGGRGAAKRVTCNPQQSFWRVICITLRKWFCIKHVVSI